MRKIVREKLTEAICNESLDYARYLIYAEQAKEEGLLNIARLFQTIAYSERIHFRRLLKYIGEIGTTSENIDFSFENESYQAEEFYPSLFELTGMMNETDSQILFNNAQQTENIHKKLFMRAAQSVSEKKDITISGIYVCRNCGFTLEGTPPYLCAVCGVSKENFKEF